VENRELEIKKLREENIRLKHLLQQSESNYNYFIDRAPIGIVLIKNGIIKDVNPKLLIDLAYGNQDELIGKSILNLIHPDFVNHAAKRLKKINTTNGEAIPLEEVFIKKDGTEIDVLVLGHKIEYDEDSFIQGFIYDITEIKQAARNNLVFKKLFEHSPDAIYILSPKGEIISQNNAAQKEIELTIGSTTGKLQFNNVFQNINWDRILTEEKQLEQNEINFNKNHQSKNAYWRKYIKIYEKKDLKYILCFSRNIDELIFYQKLLEDQNIELKESLAELETLRDELVTRNDELNKKNSFLDNLNGQILEFKTAYEIIFNSSKESILLLDTFSKEIVNVNKQFKEMSGYSSSEALNLNFYNLFADTIDLPKIKGKKIAKKFYRLENQNYLAIFTTKNGQRKFVNLYFKLIKVEDKERTLCIIHDMEEYESSKNALERSKAIFRELSELSRTAIFMYDNTGFKYTNPATSEITGYLKEELFKMKFWEVVHPDMQQTVKEKGQSRVNGKILQSHYQIKLLTKEKQIKWVDFKATKFDYPGENLAIGNAVDITEMKLYQEKLKAAKLRAEQADKLKSSFLSNMSHEIRTPLNGILGFIQLLKEDDLTEKHQHFVNIIGQSANQLLQLINDILDLSKIESGNYIPNPEELNLFTIFSNLYEIFKVQLFNINPLVSINLEVDDKNLVYNSDKRFIIQILTNLLSNAVKFTDEGNIDFGYVIENQKLKIFVNDTGIGIPKDKQSLVFDRFIQIHDHIKTKVRGTGLGLAITYQLVILLNGEIKMVSEVEKGTGFSIFLPLENKNSG